MGAIGLREGTLLRRIPDGEREHYNWPLNCPFFSLSLSQLLLCRCRDANLSLGVAAPGVDFAAISQRKAVTATYLNRDDQLFVWQLHPDGLLLRVCDILSSEASLAASAH